MQVCERQPAAETGTSRWSLLLVLIVGAQACSVDNRRLSAGPDGGAGTGGTTDASPLPSLVWVPIAGGSFAMGSDDSYGGDDNSPIHTVTVPSFEMTKTEITVAEFAECINAGWCQNPLSIDNSIPCTWSSSEPQPYPNAPVECVSWQDAQWFCEWVGARFPSEAEWEYAARSEGQATTYPWGDAPPTCALAANETAGCPISLPDPVCSHTAGNTAQGLCDMAGNVWEWVEDLWSSSGYIGAPTDGTARETGGAPSGPGGQPRVERGGSYLDATTDVLRNVYRLHVGQMSAGGGFRCARSGTS